MAKNKLIQHHTHYKEIHGYDKIILLTPSEHRKLHIRLRREGRCNIPANDLQKISNVAHQRTDKHKEFLREYYLKKHHKNNVEYFGIYTTITSDVLLHEQIAYNRKTGDIIVSCNFKTINNKIL